VPSSQMRPYSPSSSTCGVPVSSSRYCIMDSALITGIDRSEDRCKGEP
jgi:hypothetical protein